ncbi:MAG TPA: alpha/beta hydrolase [Alphaproteobacteria bacterium]|jgi:pimeloyl-ACP methyl ester carboxylesterase
MTISRANGLDIYYETAGEGRPLVLIHPLPFDHNAWLYQVAAYSAGYRTIAMDLRGMGRSDKPHDPFTLRDMADDVIGVLRDEGVTKDAIVLGCSVGSKVALMLACDHPDIFKAAVLVGGNSGPQDQFGHRIAAYRSHAADGMLYDYHLGHLRYGVTAGWADSPIGRHLLTGFAERARASFDADGIAEIFGALTVSDLTPKLAAYKTPTLIINGEHDSALAGGMRTASLLPQAEHRVLAGAGHCCFLEDPGGFDALVLDFLARNKMGPTRQQ